MDQKKASSTSTIKLAIGAASLFLFIVGLKRSFRTEDGQEVLRDQESPREDEPAQVTTGETLGRRLRNAS